ncbi:histidine kinase [Streptomyces sp. DT171]|uniref:histidine kinase n=1 Tax=Streptomyces sp. DT171 TaxID=3416524 RepID=UPI003CF0873D
MRPTRNMPWSGPRRERRRLRHASKRPGPPGPYALLPWLLMGLGAFSHLLQGRTPYPWLGGLGLVAFDSLYVVVVFRGFDKEKRRSPVSYRLLAAMGLITFGLAIGYGGIWLLFLPLFSLACGTILRDRQLGFGLIALAVLAGVVAAWRGDDASGPWTIGYGTFISGAVTAAILTLSETVMELRATRQELARTAVEKERLRFSRDLHDLLGHTLSVIVIKSEAARRLAPRDMDAALGQVADIESVGRQALAEIREAVTGYREGGLATELDRAGSVLIAAGIEPAVRRSGPPLDPRSETLLGWVAREAVTNVVRHSGAAHCEFVVESTAERVRLTVTDDGPGPGGDAATVPDGAPDAVPDTDPDRASGFGPRGVGGTGLKGLTERLAAAGGSLEAARGPRGGFVVIAELPLYGTESADSGGARETGVTPD